MVDFKVDDRLLRKALADVPQALTKRTRSAVVSMLGDFTKAMRGDQFTGYTGSSPNDRLQTRTGALRNSIRASRVTGQNFADIEGRAFTTSVYAPIHEYGGTITPKHKRYLRVPLPEALTAAGDVKGGLAPVQRGGSWETADGDPTFVRRSKSNPGEAVIYLSGPNGPVPIFALKKSVTIPGGRLRWFDTWASLAGARVRRLNAAARLAIKDATA